MKCDFEKGFYTPSIAHHNYTPMEMYSSNINLEIIYELYFEVNNNEKLIHGMKICFGMIVFEGITFWLNVCAKHIHLQTKY